MRVLIVNEVTGYMIGGVNTELVSLSCGLSARGHDVALLGDRTPRGLDGVPLYRMAIPTGKLLPVEIRRAAEHFNPNVIHVLSMGSLGVHRGLPALAPFPWVLTCHAIPPHEKKFPHFHGHEFLHYGARSLRYCLNSTSWKWLFRRKVLPGVVVHSKCVADTVARYGYEAERIEVIDLGFEVTPRRASPARAGPSQAPQLLTIGGFAHTKGHHDAISAVAELRRELPRLHYRIIGEPRDESYVEFLEERISRLGLGTNIAISFKVTEEEKRQALNAADLYVQPSHEEGFCLAYMEAAATVPRLIGCATGAIELMSRGDAAMRVVPARSPRNMAAAMRDVLSLQIEPSAVAERVKRLAERFSSSRYLDCHEMLYSRLQPRRST